MKKITALVLAILLIVGTTLTAKAEEPLEIQSPSALLMEASTGTVLYEKNADEKASPASVTKVMTVLLIFEELERGNLKLEDEVVTSAHAKSMGGSQVFLEEGEKQTVDDMLKCILISSGNDASVAMAEHIGGSEQEFVNRMNDKAARLGMKNTHFTDCCGLTDSDDHYTTARDIALMSRELITKYPQVKDYTTIWMDTITHVTAQGTKEFGLSNTNKLLRSYDGCTGLKTGSTSKALFCLSATALRNEVELIGTIMTAPTSKIRFADAAAMLNYGFGICRVYRDMPEGIPGQVQVKGSLEGKVSCHYKGEFHYLDTENADFSGVEKEIKWMEGLEAPLDQDSKAGELVYYLGGKEIGSIDILTDHPVEKANYFDYLKNLWNMLYSNL